MQGVKATIEALTDRWPGARAQHWMQQITISEGCNTGFKKLRSVSRYQASQLVKRQVCQVSAARALRFMPMIRKVLSIVYQASMEKASNPDHCEHAFSLLRRLLLFSRVQDVDHAWRGFPM